MLVGLVVGAGAGINNAVRTAMKMDQAALEKMQATAGEKNTGAGQAGKNLKAAAKKN